MPHCLVTGATSGLGLGLARWYKAEGYRVSVINRRNPLNDELADEGMEVYLCDVTDAAGIQQWYKAALAEYRLPDLWLLTAGINEADDGGLNLDAFRRVMETNFHGVLNFVGANPVWKLGTTFVCASSTTNIFPNPSCLGYAVSKWALHHIFKTLDQRYRSQGIRFRSLILGPINTGIPVSATGFQRRVRDWLAVDVDQAVPAIARFLEGNRQAFYYPKRAVWFFRALRLAMKVWPGVYR